MEQVKAFNAELVSLYETKPPISKAKMTSITKAAIRAIKFYKHVVQGVEKFILKCRTEYKIPGLYVIDSIVRQSRHQFGIDKDVFGPRFIRNIEQTFLHIYECPEEEKKKICRVLNLWKKNNVFPKPVIKTLFAIGNLEDQEELSDDEVEDEVLHKFSKNKEKVALENTSAWVQEQFENEVDGRPNEQTEAAGTPENAVDSNQAVSAKQQISSTPASAATASATTSAVIDSNALLQQLQTLTNLLQQTATASATHTSPAQGSNQVKFDKKLLDYDYGEEEDDSTNTSPATRSIHATNPGDPVTSLLANPEVLRHIQNFMQLSIAQMQNKFQQELTTAQSSSANDQLRTNELQNQVLHQLQQQQLQQQQAILQQQQQQQQFLQQQQLLIQQQQPDTHSSQEQQSSQGQELKDQSAVGMQPLQMEQRNQPAQLMQFPSQFQQFPALAPFPPFPMPTQQFPQLPPPFSQLAQPPQVPPFPQLNQIPPPGLPPSFNQQMMMPAQVPSQQQPLPQISGTETTNTSAFPSLPSHLEQRPPVQEPQEQLQSQNQQKTPVVTSTATTPFQSTNTYAANPDELSTSYSSILNSAFKSGRGTNEEDDIDDRPEFVMEKRPTEPLEVIDLDRIATPPSSRSSSGSRSRSHSRSRRRRSISRSRSRSKDHERDRDRLRRYLPPIKKHHLAVCSTTLWVGHLSKLIQEEDLSDTFGAFGDIISIDLISPRGCAFLCMNRRQDAARALDKLQNYRMHGKMIMLAWAPGKGMKGREWKDYWEADEGVSYIPWSKLSEDTDYDLLEEGGMLDYETMPNWLKKHLDEKRKILSSTDKTGALDTKSSTITHLEHTPKKQDADLRTEIDPKKMVLELSSPITAKTTPDPQPIPPPITIPLPPGSAPSPLGIPPVPVSMMNPFGLPPRLLTPMGILPPPNMIPPIGVPPPVPSLLMSPQTVLGRMPPAVPPFPSAANNVKPELSNSQKDISESINISDKLDKSTVPPHRLSSVTESSSSVINMDVDKTTLDMDIPLPEEPILSEKSDLEKQSTDIDHREDMDTDYRMLNDISHTDNSVSMHEDRDMDYRKNNERRDTDYRFQTPDRDYRNGSRNYGKHQNKENDRNRDKSPYNDHRDRYSDREYRSSGSGKYDSRDNEGHNRRSSYQRDKDQSIDYIPKKMSRWGAKAEEISDSRHDERSYGSNHNGSKRMDDYSRRRFDDRSGRKQRYDDRDSRRYDDRDKRRFDDHRGGRYQNNRESRKSEERQEKGSNSIDDDNKSAFTVGKDSEDSSRHNLSKDGEEMDIDNAETDNNTTDNIPQNKFSFAFQKIPPFHLKPPFSFNKLSPMSGEDAKFQKRIHPNSSGPMNRFQAGSRFSAGTTFAGSPNNNFQQAPLSSGKFTNFPPNQFHRSNFIGQRPPLLKNDFEHGNYPHQLTPPQRPEFQPPPENLDDASEENKLNDSEGRWTATDKEETSVCNSSNDQSPSSKNLYEPEENDSNKSSIDHQQNNLEGEPENAAESFEENTVAPEHELTVASDTNETVTNESGPILEISAIVESQSEQLESIAIDKGVCDTTQLISLETTSIEDDKQNNVEKPEIEKDSYFSELQKEFNITEFQQEANFRLNNVLEESAADATAAVPLPDANDETIADNKIIASDTTGGSMDISSGSIEDAAENSYQSDASKSADQENENTDSQLEKSLSPSMENIEDACRPTWSSSPTSYCEQPKAEQSIGSFDGLLDSSRVSDIVSDESGTLENNITNDFISVPGEDASIVNSDASKEFDITETTDRFNNTVTNDSSSVNLMSVNSVVADTKKDFINSGSEDSNENVIYQTAVSLSTIEDQPRSNSPSNEPEEFSKSEDMVSKNDISLDATNIECSSGEDTLDAQDKQSTSEVEQETPLSDSQAAALSAASLEKDMFSIDDDMWSNV